jgi:hypothetical protein
MHNPIFALLIVLVVAAAVLGAFAILNRFNQLSLDFLILNPDTSIVAAVELDDATHTREASRQADARKDHALKSAGVPLIRWNAKSLPDRVAILSAIPTVARPIMTSKNLLERASAPQETDRMMVFRPTRSALLCPRK